MLKTMLLCVLLIGLALALLAIRIILVKGGKFSSQHISQSKEMRKRVIHCVQSMDRIESMDNPHAIPERSK